jgi:hypothetical protein
MSAPSCLVFYGIRFELRRNELDALERQTDARMLVARKNGLKDYWGNFDEPGEKWLLFIGENLGVFGIEGESSAQQEAPALQGLMGETDAKLRQAGFNEVSRLYVQWTPDA